MRHTSSKVRAHETENVLYLPLHVNHQQVETKGGSGCPNAGYRSGDAGTAV